MHDLIFDSHIQEKLKDLTQKDLIALASQIRKFLIENIPKTGGHLSSNLGVVELLLTLHRYLDIKQYPIFFDVSHQSYVHKILTGRIKDFDRLRMLGGLSGFTEPRESIFDKTRVGHAGTAISLAMGYAMSHPQDIPVVFIGDASIANGVAFEALNHLGNLQIPIIIILNDNNMSIEKNVGAFSTYLSEVLLSSPYQLSKKILKRILWKLPLNYIIFNSLVRLHRKFKLWIFPNLFEMLGIRYIGLIDGHHMKSLSHIFQNINRKKITKPLLLHVVTKKGKGLIHAEENPTKYHGISRNSDTKIHSQTYTDIAGQYLNLKMKQNNQIYIFTAAMKKGTGLHHCDPKFQSRIFDVGISEEHMVALAGGLSLGKIKPVVFVYSTFLQRAFDQLFQEIHLQHNHGCVFLLDRAGIVGEDGVSHHGIFDIAYTKIFPRAVLMSPKDSHELEQMIDLALEEENPCFVRYPKGKTPTIFGISTQLEKGKMEVLIQNPSSKICVLAYGSMVEQAFCALNLLSHPIDLINIRFAKPLDTKLLDTIVTQYEIFVIIEEHSKIGGVGESILGYWIQTGRLQENQQFYHFALEDQLYFHGKREEILTQAGLDALSINHKLKHIISERYS